MPPPEGRSRQRGRERPSVLRATDESERTGRVRPRPANFTEDWAYLYVHNVCGLTSRTQKVYISSVAQLRPKAATPTFSLNRRGSARKILVSAGDACPGRIFGCGVRDMPSPVTVPDAIAVYSGMRGGRATDALRWAGRKQISNQSGRPNRWMGVVAYRFLKTDFFLWVFWRGE